MDKPTFRKPSLFALAAASVYCVSQPAAAATVSPMMTVADQKAGYSVAVGSGQNNYVVGWFEPGVGGMVSPYAADGTLITAVPIQLGQSSFQAVAVAMNGDSDFAAAWIATAYKQTSFSSSAIGGLYVQQYSADGTARAAPTPVSSVVDFDEQYIYGFHSMGSSTSAPLLVMDDDGDADVAWGNYSYIGTCDFYICGPTSGVEKIYAAAYRADGTTLRPQTMVGESSTPPKYLSGLSKLGNGDVNVMAHTTLGPGVVQQSLSPTLVAEGATVALLLPSGTGIEATASDGMGNTAVLGATSSSCEVTRFDPQGVVIGTATSVPLANAYDCYKASLAMNASGAFAVVWGTGVDSWEGSPYTNLYGQLYNADGSANGASFTIREGGYGIGTFATAINADGRLVVAWSEEASPSRAGYSVYVRRVSPQ